MSANGLNGRLVVIANEWDKAEKVIKLAERVRSEVVQPSVNELRYAGRRLVDALRVQADTGADKADFDVFVTEAMQFCYRAQHDAVDATILFVQAALNEYEEEFGLALLIQHFPGVADLRAKLQDADELIVRSREDRLARHQDYETLATQHLPVIIDEFKKIQSNRTALQQLAAAAEEKDKREAEAAALESRRFKINLWLGVGIGLAGAVLGAVLSVVLQGAPA